MARRGESSESNLIVVGLDPRRKQRHFAALATRSAEAFNLEQVLCRLSQIRHYTLDNMDSLTRRFVHGAAEGKNVNRYVANSAAEAVAYIRQVVGPTKNLAVNRASVIDELRPVLERNGYRLIDTYLSEYSRENPIQKVLDHYWQLPMVPVESVYESFAVQRQETLNGRKDYAALLGVSAAAAEDGSICFLQHFSNIGRMLQEARTLILIVGIEKIVDSREDALFQARCMGVFGLESMILNLKEAGQPQAFTEMEGSLSSDSPVDIQIILLDNGRSPIAKNGHFRNLLTCISCRACAKHCPMHDHFDADSGNYPKQYLWSFLRGDSALLDLCIGCGMCHEDCPLGINIPGMVSRARSGQLAKWPLFVKNRVLYDVWPFMRTASRCAPLTNRFLKNGAVRILMEKLTGFQREAWIPDLRRREFSRLVHSLKQEKDCP